MITLEIPDNYGLATMLWTFLPAGQAISTTWGFQDALLSGDAQLAATDIRLAMVASGRPAAADHMTTQWRFNGVNVLLRNNSSNLISGQNLTPVTGTTTATADIAPVFTTLVVSKRTALAGRHFRGRMYPPLTNTVETSIDATGNISAGELAAWQGYWNLFLNDTALQAGYPPVLLHTPVTVGPTIPPTDVTSLLVRPVVGIQRRRRARGA